MCTDTTEILKLKKNVKYLVNIITDKWTGV
jgi:hypothetical protein